MWRYLLLALAGYLGFRKLSRKLRLHSSGEQSGGSEGPEELVRDPVCGVYVMRSQAMHVREGGKDIYFCSSECHRRWAAGDNK